MAENAERKPIELTKHSHLHHAVCVRKKGVLKQIQDRQGMDELNERDYYGYTLLHYAAKYGHYDIVDCLLKNGAAPEIKTSNEQFTVLHIMALQGSDADDRIMQNLSPDSQKTISINFNRIDNMKCNPLHLACRSGTISVLDIVLNNCNLEFILETLESLNEANKTPLHEACLYGDWTVMKRIVNAYQDQSTLGTFMEALMDIKEGAKKAPFHEACRGGGTEMVKMLLEKLKHEPDFAELVNIGDKFMRTPLHYACELRSVDMTVLLLNEKAKFVKDKFGRNPLHIAARMGRKDVVFELLRIGQDQIIDIEDQFYETPLFHAAKYHRLKVVEMLVDKKANLNVVNKDLYTPFLCAAIRGYTEVCEALIAGGASVTDVDSNDRNFIHIAAEKNYANFLKKILSCQDTARFQKFKSILNSTDKDFHAPLHLAVAKGNSICVEVLLNTPSVNLEVRSINRWTPMHYAAANGHTKVMERLLEKSCRHQVRDDNNDTPLHLCCRHGHYQAAKLLMMYQTGFDSRNDQLKSPLDLAAENGHSNIVRLLFEAISEISPEKLDLLVNPTKTYVPLLHLAINGGDLSVVEFLLNNSTKKARLDIPHPISQQTPIETAVKLKHESIAMAIIKCSCWEEALKCDWVSQHGTTVFKELIRKMPLVALHVLNQCTKVERSQDHYSSDMKVSFNFEYVVEHNTTSPPILQTKRKHVEVDEVDGDETDGKTASQWRSLKRNHPLEIMVDEKQKILLDHPVTVALLNSKWKIFGIHTYFLGLFFYLLFLALLTSFVLISPNPQEKTCQAIVGGYFGNLKHQNISFSKNDCSSIPHAAPGHRLSINVWTVHDVCSNFSKTAECGLFGECGTCRQAYHTRAFSKIAALLIFIMSLLHLLLELIQFYTQGLLYWQDYANYIDLSLFICTGIFSTSALLQCVCPRSWQWQIGSVGVFLAWINLLIYLRILPIGIHILMFEQIFKTFWKAIVLTVTLVVAFSITFYMIFHVPSSEYKRSPFSTPGRAHMKLMAMTTGGLDFNSLFRLSTDREKSDEVPPELPFLGTTHFLWIIFLVLMPILLSNLLTALAIDDVKQIYEECEIMGLRLKIDFLLHMEEILPCMRNYFKKMLNQTVLDKKPSLFRRIMSMTFGIAINCYNDAEDFQQNLKPKEIEGRSSQHDLVKRVNAISSSNAEIKKTMTKMMETMALLENTMKSLQSTMKDKQ